MHVATGEVRDDTVSPYQGAWMGQEGSPITWGARLRPVGSGRDPASCQIDKGSFGEYQAASLFLQIKQSHQGLAGERKGDGTCRAKMGQVLHGHQGASWPCLGPGECCRGYQLSGWHSHTTFQIGLDSAQSSSGGRDMIWGDPKRILPHNMSPNTVLIWGYALIRKTWRTVSCRAGTHKLSFRLGRTLSRLLQESLPMTETWFGVTRKGLSPIISAPYLGQCTLHRGLGGVRWQAGMRKLSFRAGSILLRLIQKCPLAMEKRGLQWLE